ncbi:MAG: septum formation initiator family protein [Candidatus Paceibacterota bacterium]
MRNFQKKRVWRKIMESKPVLVMLIVLLLVFSWSIIGFIGKLQVTSENKKIAEKKVAELQKQKDEYNAKIEKLKTQNGVEETIRDTYGLAKEGEGLIVVVDDQSAIDAAAKRDSSGFWSHVFFWNNWFK